MLRLRKHRVKRDVLGFRLPMLTHEEPELDVSEIIVMDPDNTFFMRMGSEAMTSYHILPNHVLVIDRSLKPVTGSIVVFFHEGDFYTREYCPKANQLFLKSDQEPIIIDNITGFVCWGVVTLTLNPVLQPQHRMGRYARVCAC
jgi:DNA polymerase V